MRLADVYPNDNLTEYLLALIELHHCELKSKTCSPLPKIFVHI